MPPVVAPPAVLNGLLGATANVTLITQLLPLVLNVYLHLLTISSAPLLSVTASRLFWPV